MDIQLPGLDGYEATRRIKANPALRAIPIIAVTSYALSGDDVKAREAGCDDYVTKPFSPRALLAKVRGAILGSDASDPERPAAGPASVRRQRRSTWTSSRPASPSTATRSSPPPTARRRWRSPASSSPT